MQRMFGGAQRYQEAYEDAEPACFVLDRRRPLGALSEALLENVQSPDNCEVLQGAGVHDDAVLVGVHSIGTS